jgi:phenylacetate-CoA ligase
MGLSIWSRERLSRIRLPIWAGQIISFLPYDVRPAMGWRYRITKGSMNGFERMQEGEKRAWIFQRVKRIVDYAVRNIPFYTDLYREKGFDPASLNSFDDISRIPIIRKTDLLEYELRDRSNPGAAGYLVNTGGTSGATLGLYIHPDQMGNEWSHMHHIWGKLGFKPADMKLMFTGRSEFVNGLFYDFIRHTLSVSVYTDINEIAEKLKEIISRYKPKFIHGYPSALFEFVVACNDQHPDLLELLQNCLYGGFLGSEYPVKRFRETIEGLLKIPTVSWYGHTERCILAYEREDPYVYYPFQTYGYTEVIEDAQGETSLVGTSYLNRSSPLIRYDTEDLVADHVQNGGILNRFIMKEGRKGEFILDRNGKKIPLTGLIFGRHHGLFNDCTQIQIHQKQPGKATVLYVPVTKEGFQNPQERFDSKNVAIDFDFKELEEPIRTPAGKIKLLVDVESYQ